MNEEVFQPRPPVRHKKKRPKWQRVLRKYWPTIRFCLIILVSVALIIQLVSCAIGSVTNSSSKKNDGNETVQTTETGPSKQDIEQQAAMLLEKADFIAAGYDYQGATELLTSFAYYDDFPEMTERVASYQSLDESLVVYQRMDQITHIFFHSLIVDPSRAFDGEYTDVGYNQYMTTVDEFKEILQQMYDRGYVLVTPYQVAQENSDGTFSYCEIRIPEGKKPFIMSQDDLNYYGYMIGAKHSYGDDPIFATKEGDGFAHRIVIGEDGYPTCEYMDINGNVTTGDYDLVPVLETFIQEHPDFSYHGARAVLGMTGYEGVFGYRTAPKYEAALGTERYQQEVEEATKVALCLRDHGWVLASHSYGHPAYGAISADRVNADSQKWEDTVQSVIGDTDVILYPHGSDIAGVEKYDSGNAKFNYLYEDGYRYFFNVDGHTNWGQMGSNYYRGGRRNMDGYRMYHNPEMCDDLFDASIVFDKNRPTPVPDIWHIKMAPSQEGAISYFLVIYTYCIRKVISMSNRKKGRQSLIFENPPNIKVWASVAGKKESQGPLGKQFDITMQDSYFGQKSWELAEKRMQQLALQEVLRKAEIKNSDVDLVLSGDLLNQCIGSSFTLRNTGIPHLGLYGACSTMAESLLLGSIALAAGYGERVIALTSSHFASSERQYRFPLGYGGQRTPTAQWTVTGAGAVLLTTKGNGPKIESCTIGSVMDLGISDANNMGAAMAPAALSTITAHLNDLNRTPDDYDLIITGDLGQLGKDILLTIAQREGLSLGGKLADCGTIVFDNLKQDVHSGGSGCGCSAITLCSYFLPKLASGKLKRVLFCGTGALLSPTSAMQGLPIPGVCHAISISGGTL